MEEDPGVGKIKLYRIKHFCWLVDVVGFIPEDKVQNGMAYLRDDTPDRMEQLVDFFDSVLVTGTLCRVQQETVQSGTTLPQLRVRNIPPQFDIPNWIVQQVTLEARDRRTTPLTAVLTPSQNSSGIISHSSGLQWTDSAWTML